MHLETGLTQDIENITPDNSAANYVTKWSPTAERKYTLLKLRIRLRVIAYATFWFSEPVTVKVRSQEIVVLPNLRSTDRLW
ncbi:hypothetical protein T11_15435 [Trichinella zimbabwensis]|uniref:Uncharacterized protein n=1 Tax=Trichinella zimbabwensis TaxID=268475 RepID=A0A0V1GQP9_9BILA|nr:hypothetical protein T11_17780 [Trichinella zimbabwensis]KRZ00311.1 hypothetical protein T11_15435 [Trichinella zimbabwensis]